MNELIFDLRSIGPHIPHLLTGVRSVEAIEYMRSLFLDACERVPKSFASASILRRGLNPAVFRHWDHLDHLPGFDEYRAVQTYLDHLTKNIESHKQQVPALVFLIAPPEITRNLLELASQGYFVSRRDTYPGLPPGGWVRF
jgi:hypothetical protein